MTTDTMYHLLFGEQSVTDVVARGKERVREIAQRTTVSEFKTVRRNGATETVLYPASGRPANRRKNPSGG